MNKERMNDILIDSKVLLEGHFLLSSGRHSNRYMQCAKIFQFPNYCEEVSIALAEKFSDITVDFVIGPAIGGIILAYEVAKQMKTKDIFAERENGVMTFRRGFEVKAGMKILIVEDVITTGGSVIEVAKTIENCGAEVLGIGSIVDRSGCIIDLGYRFESLIAIDIKSYTVDECPLCKSGSKAYKPGSNTCI